MQTETDNCPDGLLSTRAVTNHNDDDDDESFQLNSAQTKDSNVRLRHSSMMVIGECMDSSIPRTFLQNDTRKDEQNLHDKNLPKMRSDVGQLSVSSLLKVRDFLRREVFAAPPNELMRVKNDMIYHFFVIPLELEKVMCVDVIFEKHLDFLFSIIL